MKDASGVKREVPVPGRTRTEARRNAEDLESRNWRIRRNLEVEPSEELMGSCGPRYLVTLCHQEGYAATESRWRLHILPEFGQTSVSQVSASMIEALIAAKRTEGYSQQTRRHLRMTLSAFFKWALRERLVGRNPVEEVESIAVPTPAPQALSWPQIEKLRDSAKVQWLADLIWVGAHLGLRYCELRKLQWPHINWKRGIVEAPRAKRIGARQRRTPPRPAAIPDVLVPYLKKMWARRRGDFVFSYDHGGPLPKSSPDARFKAAVRAAGLVSGYTRTCRRTTCRYEETSKSGRSVECPRCSFMLWVHPIAMPISFKILRSSLITRIIDTTGNVRAAQLQVDHADLKTTSNHYHATDMDVQQRHINRAFDSGSNAGRGANGVERAP
ncbi:tyrosine-type recombinase/integrase [Myxococcus sp. NMCA1]|uniref:tyrosine-type recombinase/integrase n=1 Tax=Myxococcus sp. NMCA1 TaxID=2996785 RepID=UPI002285BE4F|nr:tyrosine-type recombinase/integrase [Myxococcus sp. NMCA1]WAM23763.1 hypothetical protein OZ403_24805 [Myxococcus sp. NMCA1]